MRGASLGLLVVLACGEAPPRALSSAAGGLPDAAEQLVQRLPPGGDGCVVARVGAVPERRRGLVAPLSRASAIAWAPGAPHVAYAQTSQERLEGRSVRALLRVTDVDAARAWLLDRAPLRVVFGDDAACAEGWACWRAHVEDARTIRLDFGPWDSAAAGLERSCARLVRRRPDALEVAQASVAPPYVAQYGAPLRLATLFEIRPTPRGLVWRERVSRPAALPVLAFESLVELLEELDEERFGAAQRVRRSHRGDLYEVRAEFLWEDLELARDDRRRMRRALAEEARDELPLPPAQVAVTDLELVRRQRRLRRRRMERAPAAQRGAHARALRELLERAHAAFPEDEEIAAALVRVLVDELGDGEAAASIVDRLLGAGVSEPERWRLRRRQALALVGEAELARALVEDGVVGRRQARVAAAALVNFPEAYELAEATWVATQQARGLARSTARVPEARLPITSTLDTLVALADPDGPTKSIHAFLWVDAALPTGAEGAPQAPVFTWRDGDGSWRAGAERLDAPDHLRGLGRALFADLPEEAEVELVVAALPFGASLGEATGVVRLRGRIEGAELVVARASTRVDWQAAANLLAEPFAQLQPRLFPPPEFSLTVPSPALAQALVERARQEPDLRCDAEGEVIRCSVSPQLDSTRRAWRRVVWPELTRRAIRRP